MTQGKLIKQIGIGQSKVFEIMAGKQNPDVPFLKGIYKILKIDAKFILENA